MRLRATSGRSALSSIFDTKEGAKRQPACWFALLSNGETLKRNIFLFLATVLVVALVFVGCEEDITTETSDGSCWIFDASQDTLNRLNSSGELVSVNSSLGVADALATEAGDATVWVVDSAAARVSKLNSSGTLEKQLSGFARPVDVAVDPTTDNIFVADDNGRRVVSLDSDGNPLWNKTLDYVPYRLTLAGGSGSMVLLVLAREGIDGRRVLGYDAADGSEVFDLALTDQLDYTFDADATADAFWLTDGSSLTRRQLTDGTVISNYTEPAAPVAVAALSDGCWVFDDGGNDLFRLDNAGTVQAQISDLPGVPLLSSVGDKLWLAVTSADMVALYDKDGVEVVRVNNLIQPGPIAGVK